MPKLRHSLNDYIKAVEILAATRNLDVRCFYGKHNAICFELYMKDDKINPWDVWTIHTEHSKKREVWSREDYKKPDLHIGTEAGSFIKILETL